MRRDQVIDPRWELNLRQVAAAGKHDETSVWQGGSERFGIHRRRRDAVLFALDHQHGHRKTGSEQWRFGLGDKARCLHEAGGVGRAKRLLHQNQSIGGGGRTEQCRRPVPETIAAAFDHARSCLDALHALLGRRAVRSALLRFNTVLMIEALGHAGQIADGLVAIEEAIARSEETDERRLIAELLRLKGELLLLEGAPGAKAAAEDLFQRALDWARRQGALSLELRAATSLARLWRDQGRPAEGMALLQPVYDRFTEGFDTADLKAARALLDPLKSPPNAA